MEHLMNVSRVHKSRDADYIIGSDFDESVLDRKFEKGGRWATLQCMAITPKGEYKRIQVIVGAYPVINERGLQLLNATEDKSFEVPIGSEVYLV